MTNLSSGSYYAFKSLSPSSMLALSKNQVFKVTDPDSAIYESKGYRVEFSGDDFKYDSFGHLTGGTITGVQVDSTGYSNSTVVQIEEFSMPVDKYWNYGDNVDSLMAALTTGDDKFVTGSYNDDIRAGDGNDTVSAGAGSDTISGGSGDDEIYGNQDGDKLLGGNGTDRLFGGQGADLISGGEGDDFLFGQIANDAMYGGNGADWLHGGQGNDVIVGGADDDQMYGGLGDDTLVGEQGSDQFYCPKDQGNDVISDFQIGKDMLFIQSGVDPLRGANNDEEGNAVLMNGKNGTITLIGIDINQVKESYFTYY